MQGRYAADLSRFGLSLLVAFGRKRLLRKQSWRCCSGIAATTLVTYGEIRASSERGILQNGWAATHATIAQRGYSHNAVKKWDSRAPSCTASTNQHRTEPNLFGHCHNDTKCTNTLTLLDAGSGCGARSTPP